MKDVYIKRLLDIESKVRGRSAFLFGPRQTGKSTLIAHTIKGARYYNLLDNNIYLLLNRRPAAIREETGDRKQLIIIDEIQKLPALLDEVHLMIESLGLRFLLTGSSARKLRRGGVNLLGGRARPYSMHPLVYREVPNLDLLKALNYGLLPSIYLSDSPDEDLAAYTGIYLREEVAAEGVTRNIPAFGRFLEVAALCNGSMINYSKISNDAQVPRTTIQEYFQVLFDTLVARALPAWRRSAKRKAITTSKLYFFDTGVVRLLRNEGTIRERSPAFGAAFESYMFHELQTFADYTGKGPLAYWRSTANHEVDFILGDSIAIEVKGKAVIDGADMAGLKALREEGLMRHFILACLAERPRTVEGITILPWKDLLDRLWDGELD